MTTQDVPAVDFDHWGPDYAKDPIGYSQRLGAKCPVAHSEHHGGFWFVTGYDEVGRVTRDDATFSTHHDLPNGSTPFAGTQHPPTPFRVTPMEMDPPAYSAWRKLLLPKFSPQAVARVQHDIDETIDWCFDRFIETGEAELVMGLLSPVASIINMELLGIPVERGLEFAHHSHAIVYNDPATPEYAQVYGAYEAAVASLIDLVRTARDAEPREDLISHLTHMRVDGELIPDDKVMEVLNLVVSAGIDTTASSTACALKYLGDHPEARQYLIDNPDKIPGALEEFLRYFSPVQVLARTATKDVELGGQQIRRGDRVLVSWQAANIDERSFEQPTTIDLDRFPNRHMAFGVGMHRCMGSNFARAEMTAMLTAVLRRIPDFEFNGPTQKYGSIGIIQGYIALPVRFTPGTRSGRATRLDHLEL